MDERRRRTGQAADLLGQVDVRDLVSPADVVRLAGLALFRHGDDAPGEVADVQPLPSVRAVPVHRQRPALQSGQHERGDGLLAILAGTERVRPADDRHREAVRHAVGAAQEVRAGLGGGVGAVRPQRAGLVERPLLRGAVHLVGGDVHQRAPGPPARFQDRAGPLHVGADERGGVGDAPVHVGLGRGVDHEVRRRHQRIHHGLVAHVTLNETQPVAPLVVAEVRLGAGIGERVEHRDPRVGPRLKEEVHHVRADESGPSGHQDAGR